MQCVVILSLVLLPVLAHADLGRPKKPKKPRKTDGPYTVSVRGSYTGEGRALVAGFAVAITARVTDESGTQGMLVGTDLRMEGGYFQGTGVVCGRPAIFSGRLDGYNGDKHFRGARILCNFKEVAGPRGGRVAGVLRR